VDKLHHVYCINVTVNDNSTGDIGI